MSTSGPIFNYVKKKTTAKVCRAKAWTFVCRETSSSLTEGSALYRTNLNCKNFQRSYNH